MTRCSIHVRLSKQAGDTNTSLPGMLEKCRRLAAEHGFEVASEHIDNGLSGNLRQRPGFDAWLAEAESGEVQVLIAPYVDRLTRSGLPVAASILEVVEGRHHATGQPLPARVRLLTTDGLDSEDGESFEWRFLIAAQTAKAELRRITQRNKDARRELEKAERWTGGPVPYGCRVELREEDGVSNKYLTTDEAEGAVLREVASRLISGDNLHTVTRWLNESGHRTRARRVKGEKEKKAREWIRTSVRTTLISESTRRHVLDPATYAAVKERLNPGDSKRSTPTTAGGRPQQWLLVKGLLLCGSCGATMTTRRLPSGRTRYLCSGAKEGKTCGRALSIDAEATDNAVTASFLATYGDQRALELRTTVVGAADLEGAEEAERKAEHAMREPGAGADAFTAWQAARAALEAAQTKPLEHVRETYVSDQTHEQEWQAATITKRARMLREALAQPIKVRPATGATHPAGSHGSVVDPDRLEVVWKLDLPIGTGPQTEEVAPW